MRVCQEDAIVSSTHEDHREVREWLGQQVLVARRPRVMSSFITSQREFLARQTPLHSPKEDEEKKESFPPWRDVSELTRDTASTSAP